MLQYPPYNLIKSIEVICHGGVWKVKDHLEKLPPIHGEKYMKCYKLTTMIWRDPFPLNHIIDHWTFLNFIPFISYFTDYGSVCVWMNITYIARLYEYCTRLGNEIQTMLCHYSVWKAITMLTCTGTQFKKYIHIEDNIQNLFSATRTMPTFVGV